MAECGKPRKMFRFEYLLLMLCLLCSIAAVSAQYPDCRQLKVKVNAGSTVCEKQCIPRSGKSVMRCLRAAKPTTATVCPSRCCRSGGRCVLLMKI